MCKVKTLVLKEWADVFRSRPVVLVLLLPLVLTAVAIGVQAMGGVTDLSAGSSRAIPVGVLNQPPYSELNYREAQQLFVGQQLNTLLLVVPLAIPLTIATYSIIGEKRERSLEPLLAAPITTAELLAGKAIAAAGPAVAASWLSALVYTVALQFVAPATVRAHLLSLPFLFSVMVLVPLLTLLGTTVGLAVSSRASDPRAAEQMGMMVVVPVVGLMFAQVQGLVVCGLGMMLVILALLLVVDIILLQVAVRLFNRETVLTRWK